MTVTKGEQDIIFFRIPLCPKCKEVAGHLRAIREEHPEVTVSELNIITNIGLARRHDLMTVPALLVKGRPMTGPVSKDEILEALGFDST